MLRIGRTLAYALARRYQKTRGLEGLPVIRLGNCLRVPRWALLELALNGRVVPPGELTTAASESRRRARRRVRPHRPDRSRSRT